MKKFNIIYHIIKTDTHIKDSFQGLIMAIVFYSVLVFGIIFGDINNIHSISNACAGILCFTTATLAVPVLFTMYIMDFFQELFKKLKES